MKCLSCQTEINPKWQHAIETNACPFCGKEIMEEHLKNLFSTLADTMAKLLEYPDQLNDWMLSNYNYIKTDSPQIVQHLPKEMKVSPVVKETVDDRTDNKYIVKFTNESGEEEEVVAEKIKSDEATNEFFKRADVVKPNIDGFQSPAEKSQYLKNIVREIKRNGSPSLHEGGSASLISPEMMEQADPNAVAELNAILSGSEPDINISSEDEDIPDVVLNMAARGSGKGGSNSADMLKLHALQNRVQDSRANFESGANRGKGGFSRTS